MQKRKKPVDEARQKLTEKVYEVKTKTSQLINLINSISSEAISSGEATLKESSKSKFLNKYPKVSQDLESCLSKFLLVSDALDSLDNDDADDSDDDQEEEEGEDDEDNTSQITVGASSQYSYATSETLCDASEIVFSQDQKCSDKEFASSPETIIPEDGESSTRTRLISEGSLFSSDVTVKRFNWQADVAYPVLVTNLLSPWEFHVQLVNPENDMMEQLCIEFMKEASRGYKGGVDVLPSTNMYCCAKSADGSWYRAKIVEVYESNGECLKAVTVKVFFIDEGFSSIIPLEYLRPLPAKYATMLPSQSFHCILGGVQPLEALKKKTLSFVECSSLWSLETFNWFQKKIDEEAIFVAYFYFPPNSSYTPPHNIDRETLVCDLYTYDHNDSTGRLWVSSSTRPPIGRHVSFMMLVKGLAGYCPYFNSEVSRRKSQRAMEEAKKDLKEYEKTEPQRSVEGREVKKSSPKQRSPRQSSPKQRSPRQSSPKQRSPRQSSPASVKPKNTGRQLCSQKKNTDKKRPESIKNTRKTPLTPVRRIKSEPNKSPPRQCKRIVEQMSHEAFHSEHQTDAVITVKTEHQFSDVESIIQKDVSIPTSSTLNSGLSPEKVSRDVAVHDERPKFKFSTTLKEIELHVKGDSFIRVLVSVVVNPGLFYVHLVTLEVAKLDEMMDRMATVYDDKCEIIKECSSNLNYADGMVVVAKFSADNCWYRAIVISSVQRNEDELSTHGKQYNILYVDFGNSEVVDAQNILPLLEEFSDLPMETIPCKLADIEPSSPHVTRHKQEARMVPAGEESSQDENRLVLTGPNDIFTSDTSTWSEKAVLRMSELALTELPLMVALKSKGRNGNGLFEVYLYDTADNKDICVNQILVDENLASSKVFSKKTPTVQISEVDLENSMKEPDNMNDWNPMEDQFASNRNTYSVDIDDPGVAMLGYVEKQQNVCHQYFRGRCYRGANCNFAHVKPGESLSQLTEVYCHNIIIDLPELGDWVPVIVTSLIHPSHFWVTFPCGTGMLSGDCGEELENNKLLNQLNNDMSQYYSHQKRDDKTDLSILAEGQLIAANFEGDWYRARTLNAADDLVQVFYVDYGNTDVIMENNIRKLIPDFLHLPFQAVECHLNGVNVQGDLQNSNVVRFDQLRRDFKDLTADKLLMAQIIARSPCKELVIELYDTSVTPHQHLNENISTWNGMKAYTSTASIPSSQSNKNAMIMYPG